ncbi:succinate dehydrogenase, hydrophobic membrane anchor protein [Lichenihabitans psoromatis]|uniref:succinate dehydrogenase, hydrophobic membrane anchor protein n=2 Tax=Lichenihabitans TaxID=2723776 RepID=UPI0010383E73|nr:succinate dehydrogenase, hydrophobic membrane anchor protein [Lichenihabitans psoromatis]
MRNDTDTMRSDLSRVRHLGAARSGTGWLWHMRLTSLALLPLTIGFVFLVLSLVGRPYAEVHATLSQPFPAILMLLFIGTGIYHMQLGMRTIIEDYIHGEQSKDWALAANMFFSVAVGLTCVYAVLRLSFT